MNLAGVYDLCPLLNEFRTEGRRGGEVKNPGASSEAFWVARATCCPGRRRRQEAVRCRIRKGLSLPARCAPPGNKEPGPPTSSERRLFLIMFDDRPDGGKQRF